MFPTNAQKGFMKLKLIFKALHIFSTYIFKYSVCPTKYFFSSYLPQQLFGIDQKYDILESNKWESPCLSMLCNVSAMHEDILILIKLESISQSVYREWFFCFVLLDPGTIYQEILYESIQLLIFTKQFLLYQCTLVRSVYYPRTPVVRKHHFTMRWILIKDKNKNNFNTSKSIGKRFLDSLGKNVFLKKLFIASSIFFIVIYSFWRIPSFCCYRNQK